MDVNAAATDSSAAAPDWSTIQRDILCPLCDYNLRGLAEPRCPECGHQFEWKEILDDQHRVHPYLFEHHPESNVGSFFNTLLASIPQWRFWSHVLPQQKPRFRRLLLYWMVSTIPIWLLLATLIAIPVWEQVDEVLQFRQLDMLRLKSKLPNEIAQIINQYGSFEAVAAANNPMPNIWQLVQGTSGDVLRSPLALFAVAMIVWPWVTFAALSVFRISLRRKQIKPAHVLRCIVYSVDCACCFYGIGVVVLVGITLSESGTRWGIMPQLTGWFEAMAVASLALFGVIAYRLSFAYQHYLRFDHPEATVLLSQAIVALLFWKLFLMVNGY